MKKKQTIINGKLGVDNPCSICYCSNVYKCRKEVMDINIALTNLIEIVVLIVVFGGFGVVFANVMSLMDKSTRYDYDDEDENDDLFEDDEFTEMDREDEAELQRIAFPGGDK